VEQKSRHENLNTCRCVNAGKSKRKLNQLNSSIQENEYDEEGKEGDQNQDGNKAY
jgi:hypothetical protein